MSNLKGITITELIEMNPDDHDREIWKRIEETTDHKKQEKVFIKVLDDLLKSNKEQWKELNTAVPAMETAVMDVAFECGFRTAVKLIFSSLP